METRAALFLQSLKHITAPQHAQLESHPLLSAIVSPVVTTRQYGTYLLLMHTIAAVYEKEILPLTAHLDNVPQTKATSLIARDLEHLQCALPGELNTLSYTLCEENLSIPFASGFRYVMEGSRLGGKVMYSNIRRSLGWSAQQGAGYIAGNPETAVHWRNFLSRFTASVTGHDDENEAIRGAAFAFSSMYNFFECNRLAYGL